MQDLDIESFIHHEAPLERWASRSIISDLIVAWTMERNSPEVLGYDEILLETANSRMREQIEIVEATEINDNRTNFKLVILQTELERLKFLVRSYLRTRIAKLDRFALFCMREYNMLSKLSVLERHYVEKHQAILERYYHATFLKDVPDSGSLRRVDDTGAAGLSMVDRPDIHKSVFCKVVRPIANPLKVGPEIVDVEVGNIVLVRYSAVQEYLYDV